MAVILRTELRREYGNDRQYLTDDPIGQAVRALTGKATLSPAHVAALRALGVEVIA